MWLSETTQAQQSHTHPASLTLCGIKWPKPHYSCWKWATCEYLQLWYLSIFPRSTDVKAGDVALVWSCSMKLAFFNSFSYSLFLLICTKKLQPIIEFLYGSYLCRILQFICSNGFMSCHWIKRMLHIITTVDKHTFLLNFGASSNLYE